MKLQEWREQQRKRALEEAVELTLPSGLTVRVRRPDPAALLSWGRLPLGLANELAAEENGQAAGTAQVMAHVELMRDLLQYCLVSPRISFNPHGDEIHPREIPMEDVSFLARWAMRRDEADELRSFRQERGDAGAGGDGADVRDEALGAGGDRGSDAGAGAGSGGGAGAGAPGAGGVRFLG